MKAIGEVLSSKMTGFVAEAWQNNEAQFGSVLCSVSQEKDLKVYGVLYDIVTGAQDQLHKPAALKQSRAELKKSQPQIFSLLKTEWQLITIGYAAGEKELVCSLPPFPPDIHDFVYRASKAELKALGNNLEFLQLLAASPAPVDELLPATISHLGAAAENEREFLVEAGQELCKLYRNEFEKLGLILKKISPQRKLSSRKMN